MAFLLLDWRKGFCVVLGDSLSQALPSGFREEQVYRMLPEAPLLRKAYGAIQTDFFWADVLLLEH